MSDFVIADFISQIEHDEDNIGIIVSDSRELLENVKNNIEHYVNKIREAETPLDILINTDYLTDLIDIKLKKKKENEESIKQKRLNKIMEILKKNE